MPKSTKLIIMANEVTTDGKNCVKPFEYLSPTAHTTSKTPAVIRIIQLMFDPYTILIMNRG
jgi:hypothetical protein